MYGHDGDDVPFHGHVNGHDRHDDGARDGRHGGGVHDHRGGGRHVCHGDGVHDHRGDVAIHYDRGYENHHDGYAVHSGQLLERVGTRSHFYRPR